MSDEPRLVVQVEAGVFLRAVGDLAAAAGFIAGAFPDDQRFSRRLTDSANRLCDELANVELPPLFGCRL